MVESTAVSCIQSSHPDKYNNSVDRIISKEEEREDPRRELQSSSSTSTVVFPQIHISTRTTRFLRIQCILQCFHTQSSKFPAIPCKETILHTELILLQEILQLQGSSRADQYKASSSNCSPCIQAFYTAESSYKAPYSIPGPHSTSRLPVILPGRNSILHGRQHPRSPYSSSQVHSYKDSTRRNRIHSKG